MVKGRGESVCGKGVPSPFHFPLQVSPLSTMFAAMWSLGENHILHNSSTQGWGKRERGEKGEGRKGEGRGGRGKKGREERGRGGGGGRGKGKLTYLQSL